MSGVFLYVNFIIVAHRNCLLLCVALTIIVSMYTTLLCTRYTSESARNYIFLYKRSKYFCICNILYMFFHALDECTHKCTILLLMTKMEVSWEYDIQNRYAKIIPPKILDRISLMLINYNIKTSNTREDLLILS
jgi:hypothetical protein